MKPTEWLRAVTDRQRFPWTNSARTIGACTHDVIYSRCYCHLRKPTPQ